MAGTFIKSRAGNQTASALSSGEAEYYAMVKAATVAIGVHSIVQDMGVPLSAPINIHTDMSADIGVAIRVGIGKVRHIEVSQLIMVKSEDSLADALTKAVTADDIGRHVAGIGAEIRRDRHARWRRRTTYNATQATHYWWRWTRRTNRRRRAATGRSLRERRR